MPFVHGPDLGRAYPSRTRRDRAIVAALTLLGLAHHLADRWRRRP